MKKVLSFLLALAFVMSLIHMQAAALQSGQTCPDCGEGMLIIIAKNSSQHAFSCSNTHCEHGSSSGYLWEDHHGGTACTAKPVCEECGQTYSSILGHDWLDANCTQPKRCSRCDATEGEPLGHDWSGWTETTAPTCTTAAIETRTCSRGDATETRNGRAALGHTGGTATCTSQAVCTRCQQPYGDALGHDWLDADCTQPKRCSRCDATEGEPLGHDWSDWLETTAPTCTEKGEKTRTCKRDGCTASEKEEIPPSGTGHKPGKAVKENEEIHCVSDSSYDEVVYCTVCKQELSRKHVTYKSSHDYQPWEWHETITRIYYKCTKCGNFYWLHNPESWNMKPGLVRYVNGDSVDYKAYSTGPDDDGVLTVTPIKHTERDNTEDISLYLTPDDIYVWTWEKMNRIELVRDKAVLAIDPREITPEMYGLKENEVPDYYVFTLTPSGKDGWQVRSEVLLGEKKLAAQELKGITLTAANGRETEIRANGVYTAE